MASWVARPARSGIAMSLLPHTMRVGTDSSPARSRRSCSRGAVAKFRHSAAPLRTPSGVLATAVVPPEDPRVVVGLAFNVPGDNRGGARGNPRRRTEHPEKGPDRRGQWHEPARVDEDQTRDALGAIDRQTRGREPADR